MISNKIIQAYNKAVENINRAVAKEIDSFDIDFERVAQYFYIFIRDEKYEAVIIKHQNKYNYDIKIFSTNDNIIYAAAFKFNEFTGKSKIYEVHQLLEVL